MLTYTISFFYFLCVQEKNVQEEREKVSDINVKAGSVAAKEINQLKEELATAKTNSQKTIKKLSSVMSVFL